MTIEWTIEKALMKGAEMEIEAYNFYREQAEKDFTSGSKKLLTELAADEKEHLEKFQKALKNPSSIKINDVNEKVPDLELTDHLLKVSLDSESNYQQILIYAAQKEKRAHDFYIQLAIKYKGTLLGEMVASFANDELRHKYKLEKEYDEVILRWM